MYKHVQSFDLFFFQIDMYNKNTKYVTFCRSPAEIERI